MVTELLSVTLLRYNWRTPLVLFLFSVFVCFFTCFPPVQISKKKKYSKLLLLELFIFGIGLFLKRIKLTVHVYECKIKVLNFYVQLWTNVSLSQHLIHDNVSLNYILTQAPHYTHYSEMQIILKGPSRLTGFNLFAVIWRCCQSAPTLGHYWKSMVKHHHHNFLHPSTQKSFILNMSVVIKGKSP